MKKLEDYMKESIFKQLREGYKNYSPQNIKSWYLKNSAQILMILTQYAWTINTESLLELDEEN